MEPEMEIRSLQDTGFATLFRAFSHAFADYEVQVSELQLQTMLTRRGYLPKLSFGAFDGDELVAFTLNGIGLFGGIPTAYDTGTGTLATHRGRGLATKIFEHSIPYLREVGIQQYLLEVLQHNTKAVSIYRNLGFEVSREFNYFMQANEKVNGVMAKLLHPCSIQEVDVVTCQSASDFSDFHPSWQNNFESIGRSADDFLCFGAFVENRLMGYCIFEPTSGDVTQLAVAPMHRRKGIGSALLLEALSRNKYATVKVINTDATCIGMTAFLKARSMELKGQQFEMIKAL